MNHINSKKSALIFGCGYLGNRVANRLVARGWDVYAVTRNTAKAMRLQHEGIRPIIADWNCRQSLRDLPKTDRTLVAVGWDRSGRRSQYDVYVRGLQNALPFLSPASNIVYISSTGVFHHCDGRWVDESSPCNPTIGSGGWAHLQAELLLRRPRVSAPVTVLRIAGLYGPDRVPRGKDIASGKPLSVPTDGYLNLIHVDDAAEAVIAAWETNHSQRKLYVVSDGSPVIRRQYYQQIAAQLHQPMPEFVEPEASDPASRRASTNKRIWAARFRRDLCPTLMYPDYRAGLAAIIGDQSH